MVTCQEYDAGTDTGHVGEYELTPRRAAAVIRRFRERFDGPSVRRIRRGVTVVLFHDGRCLVFRRNLRPWEADRQPTPCYAA